MLLLFEQEGGVLELELELERELRLRLRLRGGAGRGGNISLRAAEAGRITLDPELRDPPTTFPVIVSGPPGREQRSVRRRGE